MKILVLGAGSSKLRWANEDAGHEVVRLDFNAGHRPDIVHDLNVLPVPVPDESFDQIHASHILEHTGRQGDARFFFSQFADFWRILKPNGLLIGAVPHWQSVWAWGDPSHTRVINQGSLYFLDQDNYLEVGSTAMSEFRDIYKASFKVEDEKATEWEFIFMLRKK